MPQTRGSIPIEEIAYPINIQDATDLCPSCGIQARLPESGVRLVAAKALYHLGELTTNPPEPLKPAYSAK
jgi:hypothetical protein